MHQRIAEVVYTCGSNVDGRYELRRDIGNGGLGRVFEAVHLFTGRSVAVKFVATSAPSNLREELNARLVREARALASVRHPNVVEVLDGGVLGDGTPFLVMEMLDGRTLEGLLASRGRLSAEDTVAVALQVCDALEVAHAAGVVHRDVKPSNVMITRDHAGAELIKLVDFGIALIAERAEERLTQALALVGTPAYMSPEQLLGPRELNDPTDAGPEVDAQSDVYALGVTMFECLTGQLPYKGTYQQILLRVCSREPAPSILSVRADVPKALAEIIGVAMTRDRSVRYAGVGELRRALRGVAAKGRAGTNFFGIAPEPEVRPVAQRRKIPRAPYVTPVRLVVDGVIIDGRTEDASTGGVLMICRQSCPADARGSLRFALPMEGTLVTVEVAIRWARAARVEDPEGPRALGLEFVAAPPGVVASLARYVKFMGVDELERVSASA